MLLQFVVENFRSFQKESMLNMIPAKKTREHKEHILLDEEGKKAEAVPFVALYGANASGKSNLVSAISFAKDLIVTGTRGEQSIAVVPFRLDTETRKKASKFEFVIKHQGVIYTYGFMVSSKQVEEEWLFAVFQKQEVRLFERVTRDHEAVIEFGNKMSESKADKQMLELVAKTTRPNQLFLTEANDRNVAMLMPLMRWFRNNLAIIRPHTRYHYLEPRAHTDKQFIGFLEELLRQADIGISGIKVEKETLDWEKHFPGMPTDIKDKVVQSLNASEKTALVLQSGNQFYTIARDVGEPEMLSLKMSHKGHDGGNVDFDTEDESDGTLRIMHLAPALLDLQKNEKVYVIDEIDRSMHPLLGKMFVEMFLKNSVRGASKGQLIVTTHDTGLLDMELRKDEVWFVEKDKGGNSKLASLAEFKVRSDLKVEKGYLNGRFGAIPLIKHQALHA